MKREKGERGGGTLSSYLSAWRQEKEESFKDRCWAVSRKRGEGGRVRFSMAITGRKKDEDGWHSSNATRGEEDKSQQHIHLFLMK